MNPKFVSFLCIFTCLNAVNAFVPPRQVNRVDTCSTRHVLAQKQKTAPSTKTSLSAVTAATIAASSVLPSFKALSLACLIPPCLGFYKREYGVSYGYGGAVSLAAYMVYSSLPAKSGIAAWHAAAITFYGVRLNAFLLYRELTVKSIREFRDKIESKATGSRISRAPVILSCAFLYFCLVAPLLITAQQQGLSKPVNIILKALISTTWGGFLLAAVGDVTKSVVKAKNGSKHLVTSGIYKFLRHPNYTAEIVGWTSSALAALVVAIFGSGKYFTPLSVCTILGACGIDFVLLAATRQLEKKQMEKYGNLEEYKQWTAWAGFQLPEKDEDGPHIAEPHLEVSQEEEERGSGI